MFNTMFITTTSKTLLKLFLKRIQKTQCQKNKDSRRWKNTRKKDERKGQGRSTQSRGWEEDDCRAGNAETQLLWRESHLKISTTPKHLFCCPLDVWELLACLQVRSGLWLTLEDWLSAHRRSKQNCKEIQVRLHILWDKLEPFVSCINRRGRVELCSGIGYSTWRLYELLLHYQDQTGKDLRDEGSILSYGFRSFKSTVKGGIHSGGSEWQRILTSP